MNVCFRTDASIEIGSGHVMRCLTLAEALHASGATVRFFCRELLGNLSDYIENKGFPVTRLSVPENMTASLEGTFHARWLGVPWQADAEEVIEALGTLSRPVWMVVDHYAIALEWENKIRPSVGNIMVIDDLADRCHDCDVLLDQNMYDQMEHRYDELVPDAAEKLLGPKYALLRQEFFEARKRLVKRDSTVRRILVFFGGCDPSNQTKKALDAISLAGRDDLYVDVVVGSNNPHKTEIESLCRKRPLTGFHCQINNMAELMLAADLAIGGGGATTWERMCVGLPALIISLAENQVKLSEDLAKINAIEYIGAYTEADSSSISAALNRLLQDEPRLKRMSEIGISSVDGKGCARVIDCLSAYAK